MKDFMLRLIDKDFAVFFPTTPKGFKECNVGQDGTMTLNKKKTLRGQTKDVYVIDDYAENNTENTER